jgi:hypothetical protein
MEFKISEAEAIEEINSWKKRLGYVVLNNETKPSDKLIEGVRYGLFQIDESIKTLNYKLLEPIGERKEISFCKKLKTKDLKEIGENEIVGISKMTNEKIDVIEELGIVDFQFISSACVF